MSRSYSIESGAIVNVPIKVDAPADPTGGAVSFSIVATSETDAGAFTAGTWVAASWDATKLEAIALTPLVGASGAALVLTEGKYKVYTKDVVGSETPITLTGVLTVA